MAITPNGEYVYVVNNGEVSVISTATNLVVATITGLSAEGGIAVTPNGEHVYVSNQYGSNQYGSVSVISTATNTVITTVTGLNQPGELAITPNGGQVYVVSGNYGTVSVISTASNIVTTLTGFNQPYGVAIAPNGEYAYVTNYDGDTVSVINTTSNTVTTTINITTIPFDIGPTAVEITPDGAYAYVVDAGNGSIFVISLVTNTVVSTITGLTGAVLMAITPNGAYAYIPLSTVSNRTDVINVLPAANVTPSSWTMDVGQTAQFTANPSDGSGTYTSYQWYLDGIAQNEQASSTFSYTPPTSPGSHSVAVAVTDSADLTSAQSDAVSVAVNSALATPTASASNNKIDQGQTSSLISTAVTSGTSPYTYQWLVEAPGDLNFSPIASANSANYDFATDSSTANGTWSFELQVTDSASTPNAITSTPASVTVYTAPSISVSPSSWSMDVGQSETFTASASNGSGTYTGYLWYVNGSAQYEQTAATFSFAPPSVDSYLITAMVTDSTSTTSDQSNAATVTVNAALAAPTVTPTSITVDQ